MQAIELENTAFSIFSQLNLGERDETLISAAEAKQEN